MKILLLSTPQQDQPLARDMAGGLGITRGELVVLPPLDLAYFAAALRKAGHSVSLFDPDTEGWTVSQTMERCLQEGMDAVICSASLPSLHNDSRFVRELRERSGVKVAVHTNITQTPILEELLRLSQADFGLYGECEMILHDILTDRTRHGTFRLAANGSLELNPKPVVEQLDDLPHPARDLLPKDRYRYFLLGDDRAITTVQTSRGCPFKCAYYCPYPLVQGKAWRARSPEHVLDELTEIQNTHSIHDIFFRDAVFTLNKERTHAICEGILKRKLSLRWWCETRADGVDERLLRVMRQAGCQGINFGVETGDPEVLASVAKAGLTHERLAQVVHEAQHLGIQIHFLLMVGLPDETRQSLYMTHQLVSRLNPDSIGVTIVTPYPGTPLHDDAVANGWIESTEWRGFDGHSAVLHTDHLSAEDLRYGRNMILKLYRLQNSRRWRRRWKFRARSKQFASWAAAGAPPAHGQPRGASPSHLTLEQ